MNYAAGSGVTLAVLVLWFGAYALVTGIALIALSFRLRTWSHGHGSTPMPRPA